MKTADTRHCIADERGFRPLRGNGTKLALVQAGRADDFADWSPALPGTGRNRSGGISAGTGSKDADEIERPRLAKHIVESLAEEWQKGEAGRIVLAAGPMTLGVLRQAVPKKRAQVIRQEFDNDLSGIPDRDLPTHLTKG